MFKDGHTCQIEGIGRVRIILFDEMIRELKDVRYCRGKFLRRINLHSNFNEICESIIKQCTDT